MTDKRTYDSVNAQIDTPTAGVGVRHNPTSAAPQGGEYLQNYTVFKPLDKKNERDPRLDEFRQLGLHHAWQEVASEIGYDNFLKMWRILDAELQFQDVRYGLLFNLRRYKSYLYHQKIDYIRNCYRRRAMKPYEITEKINRAYCEKNEKSYIRKIIKRDKIKV